jgi:carbonic anhydrase/acetyltransferase-like protein (isoleucine patch superfamily)
MEIFMQSIDPSVVIKTGAVLTGSVTIGPSSSIWYNSVLRADSDSITIGAESNIQDGCVLHVDTGFPIRIADGVTVGHGAILHGCSIGSNTVIGMGSIILNGASIGRNCIIGAGALVTQHTVIPDGSLALGVPAKIVRSLTPEEIQENRANALEYLTLSAAGE